MGRIAGTRIGDTICLQARPLPDPPARHLACARRVSLSAPAQVNRGGAPKTVLLEVACKEMRREQARRARRW